MSTNFLIIDGLNVTQYITTGGYKWTQEDIDAPNSGRDAGGTMRRKRIATKDRLEITCRELTGAQIQLLVSKLKKGQFSVTYYLPETGASRTSNFYNSQRAAGVEQEIDGVIYYDETKFNLIEV